jgi:hypothetical protein
MRETAGRLLRILYRSPATTTDPAMISSHIANWRPIGHDPAHGRLVNIDSAMIREPADRARAHDRATLVMVCVDSPSLQPCGVRHTVGRTRMACEK